MATSEYLNKAPRPYWLACKHLGEQYVALEFPYEQGQKIGVHLGFSLHSDHETSDCMLTIDGRPVLPSNVFGILRNLDAYFEDYGKGPVAHFMPDHAIEALRLLLVGFTQEFSNG